MTVRVGTTQQISGGGPPPVVVTITTTSLPTATEGQAYSYQLAASGGVTPYTWAATGVPAGMTLSTAGVLSGTPTVTGNSTITVTATDSSATPVASAPKAFTFTVNSAAVGGGAAIVITTLGVPAAIVGTPFSFSLSAVGGKPPYTWTRTGGGLPTGLTLSPSGVISGTATGVLSPQLLVNVVDSSTPQLSNPIGVWFVVAINPPTGFYNTSPTQPAATTGVAWSSPLSATGGTPPYTWSLTTQTSSWITISGNTLSGTPTATGQAIVAYSCTDSSTPANAFNATGTFVVGSSSPITITTTSLPAGTSGVAYTAQTVTPHGGTPPYAWAASGLPPGMTCKTNPQGYYLADSAVAWSASIGGTPTVAGNYTIQLTVTDAHVNTATFSITLTISLGMSPATIGGAIVGINYNTSSSSTVTATGGTAPYTYSMTGGPPGISINPTTGVMSGAPTSAGTYTLSITATDATGFPGTVSRPMQVFTSVPPATNMWRGYLFSNDLVFNWWPDLVGNPDWFNVYRNGVQVQTHVVMQPVYGPNFHWYWMYRDNTVAGGTTYNYTVRAVVCNHESADSPTLTLTTPSAAAITPSNRPVAPTAPVDPATWYVPYTPNTGGTTWLATVTLDNSYSSYTSPPAGIPGTAGPTGKLSQNCSFQYALNQALPGDEIVLTAGAIYTAVNNYITGADWIVPVYPGPGYINVVSSIAANTILPVDNTDGLRPLVPYTLTAAPAANATTATLSSAWTGRKGYFVVMFFGTDTNQTCYNTSAYFTPGSAAINWLQPLRFACSAQIGVAVTGGVTPTDIANMPTLQMKLFNGIYIPESASNLRFVGINFAPQPTYNVSGVMILTARTTTPGTQGLPADTIPTYVHTIHYLTLDRCIVGNNSEDSANYRYIKNGILYAADHFVVTQCYFYGIGSMSAADDNAIGCQGGAYQLIRNNHIEATSEGFVSGGGWIAQDQQPDNIVYCSNLNVKPSWWTYHYDPSTSPNSLGNKVKNHYEYKAGSLLNAYHNTHIGSWHNIVATGAQYGRSFVFGPKDGNVSYSKPQFGNPWNKCTDLNIHDNLFYNVGSMIVVFSYETTGTMTGVVERVWLHNNQLLINPPITNFSPNATSSIGIAFQGQLTDMVVEHNTLLGNPASPNYPSGWSAISGIRYLAMAINIGWPWGERYLMVNNIIHPPSAILADGMAAGTPTINAVYANSYVQANLLVQDTAAYPGTNWQNIPLTSVGFTNFQSSYRPPSTVTDWNVTTQTYATTDGQPIGATF